jgi:hypothetical protein
MARLTAAKRNKLPVRAFALAGGRYPINDPSHARNALARASQHASPAEKATIRRKVKAKYPAIDVSGLKKMKANGGISEKAARKNGLGEERSEREEDGEEDEEPRTTLSQDREMMGEDERHGREFRRYKDATQRIYGD